MGVNHDLGSLVSELLLASCSTGNSAVNFHLRIFNCVRGQSHTAQHGSPRSGFKCCLTI